MITSRDLGTLPSNTETNPKEQVKAIALRSGKVHEQEEKEKKDQGGKKADTSTCKSSNSTPALTAQSKIVILPLFPAALKKAKLDAQFGKFLEVFKKLHINILFADALMQMPSYAKFLKDILANKRKLEDHMTINLTENCSALVQNKIPPKLKDPGSFSIPCMIGDVFHKSLCDLGASINLMPLSVFRKLGLGGPKPTRMSLQLEDRSIKYPRGVIEDVLVKDAMKDPLEDTLTTELKEDDLDEERAEIVAYFNANHPLRKPIRMRLEDLGDRRDLTPPKSSIEEPPTLELKPLLPHLKCYGGKTAASSQRAQKGICLESGRHQGNKSINLHAQNLDGGEVFTPCATTETTQSKDARGSEC
ncbi:uncharacterized protein [Primulina huaijiensis]|uniref:uncharacterized protein n=1 Tax=Primulina huaijiensis TaxID=1492673 RepID=UPI003CC758DE